ACRTFAGLSRATKSLAPDRLWDAYTLPGASLTQYAIPAGAVYGRPRVLSNPSVRDQATIARPIRLPRLSDRARRFADIPTAERVWVSESAMRWIAARVVGSASLSSESSTIRSAAIAASA